MRLALGVVSFLVGCSASESSPQSADQGPFDTGPPATDASTDTISSKLDPDAKPANTLSAVYAVHAGTQDMPAFRVCLDPSKTPLPNDRPMPLANYPGVAPGGMSSIGNQTHAPQSAFLVNALDVQNSTTDHSAVCSTIATDKNLSYQKSLGTLSFDSPIQILVVYGPGLSPQAKVVSADAMQLSQGGSLRLEWGNFATSLQGPAAAKFGTQNAANDSLGAPAFGTLEPTATAVTFPASPAPTDFDDYGVTVDGKFTSLAAIQHVSDPTTTPGKFFGSRVNGYALLLVDDQNDDAAISRHIVAVPLVP